MRISIILGGVCAALGLSLAAAPTTASAACSGATTGTIIGGVGGALVGNAISKGGGGAIIGGLGGAVVGHEIGKSGCRSYRSTRYYRAPRRTTYSYSRSGHSTPSYYYDSYGRPIYAGAGGYEVNGYRRGGACRAETHSYYNERGELVQRSVSAC